MDADGCYVVAATTKVKALITYAPPTLPVRSRTPRSPHQRGRPRRSVAVAPFREEVARGSCFA